MLHVNHKQKALLEILPVQNGVRKKLQTRVVTFVKLPVVMIVEKRFIVNSTVATLNVAVDIVLMDVTVHVMVGVKVGVVGRKKYLGHYWA